MFQLAVTTLGHGHQVVGADAERVSADMIQSQFLPMPSYKVVVGISVRQPVVVADAQ
jgi:hypothetical protein